VTPTWGVLELPPSAARSAPLARLPLGDGAVALLAMAVPALRRRDD